MKIFWTEEAIEDRSKIYDYLEEKNPPAAGSRAERRSYGQAVAAVERW